MRLFEAILDANHRALAGDPNAGIRPSEFANSLPVVGLTCVDPRLEPLIPEVLGLRESDFLCLRTPGNIVPGPASDIVRALALACALKHAGEVAIIGHTDCAVRRTSVLELTERFRALGVERAALPDNLSEFFGLFASEHQNVIRGAELLRASPWIGPQVPVHGLMVDLETGRLDWVVNGYQTLAAASAPAGMQPAASGPLAGSPLAEFQLGEMKFPEHRIGETAQAAQPIARVEVVPPAPPAQALPPKIKVQKDKPPPVPPPIRPGLRLQPPWKPKPGAGGFGRPG